MSRNKTTPSEKGADEMTHESQEKASQIHSSQKSLNKEYVLVAKNISHYFADNTAPIIKNFSVSIKAGQILALTGRSGSGKSTLLHILSGLKKPTKGQISIDGIDIHELDNQELAQLRNTTIGFVYQSHCLLKDFNAYENIAMAARVAENQHKAMQKALLSMQMLNIEHLAEKMPQSLSGGEKQRVAIARAMVNQPKILFADEPTGNLDRHNARLILKSLQTLQEKSTMTVIIATHDQEIIKQLDHHIELETQHS